MRWLAAVPPVLVYAFGPAAKHGGNVARWLPMLGGLAVLAPLVAAVSGKVAGLSAGDLLAVAGAAASLLLLRGALHFTWRRTQRFPPITYPLGSCRTRLLQTCCS